VENEARVSLGAKNQQKEKSKMNIDKIIKEEIENVKMLDYHTKNKIPFSENIYRIGSDNYFRVIREARASYKRGEINAINAADKDLFENSDLGEWVIFEGEKVPLDFPMYNEGYMGDWAKHSTMNLGQVTRHLRYLTELPGTDSKTEAIKERAKMLMNDLYYTVTPGQMHHTPEEMEDISKHSYKDLFKMGYDPDYEPIDEAKKKKKKKKKDPPLNKPTKNTGGGKKYKVYVRSKSGGVKKVTYGDKKGGLKGNWNSAEARKSFAARHKCAEKKDKTKSGYWACRAHKDFGKNVPGRFW
jgi:hypothetical protein